MSKLRRLLLLIPLLSLIDNASANGMYDPHIGRFCSKDPIGFEGSKWNLFQYCNSSPLGRLDPTGQVDCEARYNACMVGCMAVPPPWPWNTGSKKVKKWKHYAYCEAKCQADYMACLAQKCKEATEDVAEYCARNPGKCCIVGGILVIGGTCAVIEPTPAGEVCVAGAIGCVIGTGATE